MRFRDEYLIEIRLKTSYMGNIFHTIHSKKYFSTIAEAGKLHIFDVFVTTRTPRATLRFFKKLTSRAELSVRTEPAIERAI